MNKKKFITIIILALGLVLMVVGILILCQAGTDHCGRSQGMSRASTSIKFAGDFYTTSAQATGLAANAVIDLYKLTSVVAGISFMFAGGLDLCITILLTDFKNLFSKKENTAATVDSNEAE